MIVRVAARRDAALAFGLRERAYGGRILCLRACPDQPRRGCRQQGFDRVTARRRHAPASSPRRSDDTMVLRSSPVSTVRKPVRREHDAMLRRRLIAVLPFALLAATSAAAEEKPPNKQVGQYVDLQPV